MITLDEARTHFSGPGRLMVAVPSRTDASTPTTAVTSAAAPAAITILNLVLFLTILISPLVFIEPSPYEAAAAALGLACLMARVPIPRAVWPLAVLLILWNVSGGIALVPVVNDDQAIRYVAVSMFMAFTAIIYAALFAEDTMRRLEIMRIAYVLAASFAVVLGIIGYFNIGGTADWFAKSGRATGTFKDPNVFGPFLILPILLLMQPLLTRGIRPLSFVALLLLLVGLLLSFSRGAWMHFLLSAVVMVGLDFLTAQNDRSRMRIIVLTLIAVAALAALFTVALSFEAIGEMFKERAKIVQDYDVGSGGRFSLQELAVGNLLQNPFGLGPYEFSRLYGLQQHNVYLQAFLVYGWVGGFAYIGMIAVTLIVGLRAAFAVTPWQPYTIATLATFAGEVGEGLIIDTDHWRHYFLLLGLIWALYAATINARRRMAVS